MKKKIVTSLSIIALGIVGAVSVVAFETTADAKSNNVTQQATIIKKQLNIEVDKGEKWTIETILTQLENEGFQFLGISIVENQRFMKMEREQNKEFTINQIDVQDKKNNVSEMALTVKISEKGTGEPETSLPSVTGPIVSIDLQAGTKWTYNDIKKEVAKKGYLINTITKENLNHLNEAMSIQQSKTLLLNLTATTREGEVVKDLLVVVNLVNSGLTDPAKKNILVVLPKNNGLSFNKIIATLKQNGYQIAGIAATENVRFIQEMKKQTPEFQLKDVTVIDKSGEFLEIDLTIQLAK